ncbi:MAG: hypothetical protein HC913_08835 [Microscillaceae bacterium]|nr:hypothetical protein [Microscillaceae bacterium]
MDDNLYHEYLDKYFLNQLSESEKIAFEQLISRDPVKSEEFAFQKKVIEGVQHFRKAQIKQRLNRIPEPQSSSYQLPALAWLSTGAAATLLIFTLGFALWKTSQPKTLNNDEKTEINQSEIAPSLPQISTLEPKTTPAPAWEKEADKDFSPRSAPQASQGAAYSTKKQWSSPNPRPKQWSTKAKITKN